jgi:hypothetical protein
MMESVCLCNELLAAGFRHHRPYNTIWWPRALGLATIKINVDIPTIVNENIHPVLSLKKTAGCRQSWLLIFYIEYFIQFQSHKIYI